MTLAGESGRPRRAAAVVIAIVAVVMTLSACSSTSGGTKPSNSSSGAASGMRTVVDNQGRSVRIPVNITRVATNLPALPPAIYLLGGITKLVATTPVGISSFLKTVDPGVTNIATNAFPSTATISSEALLADKPQVVLTSQYQTALLPTYQRLGIPVLLFGGKSAPDDPKSLEAEMDLLAQVLGGDAPARAKQWDSSFETNLAMITAKTSAIPKSQRPTVYYAAADPLTTDPSASWIAEGGGQNLSAENGITQGSSFAFPTISAESLVKWNPQVIVTQQAPAAKTFQAQPQFTSLTAVREHQVHAAPYGIWPWATGISEQPLQPLWMAKTLYPTLFPNVNLIQVTKDFYSKFYFYTLTDQQATQIVNATLPQ